MRARGEGREGQGNGNELGSLESDEVHGWGRGGDDIRARVAGRIQTPATFPHSPRRFSNPKPHKRDVGLRSVQPSRPQLPLIAGHATRRFSAPSALSLSHPLRLLFTQIAKNTGLHTVIEAQPRFLCFVSATDTSARNGGLVHCVSTAFITRTRTFSPQDTPSGVR